MDEEERQSLAEHWVLEFVANGSYPVDWFGLTTEQEFTSVTNRSDKELRVPDLREALVRLAAEGAVRFRREGLDIPPAGPLTEPALRAAIRGERPTYQYGLTPVGGARWERLVQPDWARYTRSHPLSHNGAVHAGFVMAQERALAEELLHWQLLRHGCVTLPGSVLAMTSRPWRLLGWKELSHGWRIDFYYQAGGEPQVPPKAEAFFKHIYNWYESPFRKKPWLIVPEWFRRA